MIQEFLKSSTDTILLINPGEFKASFDNQSCCFAHRFKEERRRLSPPLLILPFSNYSRRIEEFQYHAWKNTSPFGAFPGPVPVDICWEKLKNFQCFSGASSLGRLLAKKNKNKIQDQLMLFQG
jgi:hypothetical protein